MNVAAVFLFTFPPLRVIILRGTKNENVVGIKKWTSTKQFASGLPSLTIHARNVIHQKSAFYLYFFLCCHLQRKNRKYSLIILFYKFFHRLNIFFLFETYIYWLGLPRVICQLLICVQLYFSHNDVNVCFVINGNQLTVENVDAADKDYSIEIRQSYFTC